MIKTSKYMLYNADCLDIFQKLKNVSLVLADPPYGSTTCAWDKVIPFEPMWEGIFNCLKPYHACVLFCKEPFGTLLRMSNIARYKYDWIWIKNRANGFVNAKLKPLNKHELISVFSEGSTANGAKHSVPYYPQDLIPTYKTRSLLNTRKKRENGYFRPLKNRKESIQTVQNYPSSILYFDIPVKYVHPTQKPVPLLEYLIRTYTHEDEIILDFCAGSGSVGVACMNTHRRFIGVEKEERFFTIMQNRVRNASQALANRSWFES